MSLAYMGHMTCSSVVQPASARGECHEDAHVKQIFPKVLEVHF